MSAHVFNSPSRRLVPLLSTGWIGERCWSPEELNAILKHQMDAPLDADLSPHRLRTTARTATDPGKAIRTFRELLEHPRPPLPLLRLVRDFARSHLNSRIQPLPPEVAEIVYYAAAAVARLRCRTRITRLADDALQQAVETLRGQPWLDGDTRRLFDAAARAFDRESRGAITDGTLESGP